MEKWESVFFFFSISYPFNRLPPTHTLLTLKIQTNTVTINQVTQVISCHVWER